MIPVGWGPVGAAAEVLVEGLLGVWARIGSWEDVAAIGWGWFTLFIRLSIDGGMGWIGPFIDGGMGIRLAGRGNVHASA